MKTNKLLSALLLAGFTVSQFNSVAFAADVKRDVIIEDEGQMNFTDVSPNHWAYSAIKNLSEEYNVLGGFPDGTFRGNRNLSRYEFAAAISKVMGRVEELIAKGGKPGLSRADLDKLKKEFMTELEDVQTELKRLAKDQQDMQKDLDDTKDQIDMVKEMLPKVKLTGDAAFRYEMVSPSSNMFASVNSAPQVRLRLGAVSENNGGFVFGTRFSTSTANDITNSFVSLGNLNSKFGVNLDQLYVAARPWDGMLDLTFGRHANPFMRTTELAWDEDVTFDGAYLKLNFGDKYNYFSILGDYSILNMFGVNTPVAASNVTASRAGKFSPTEAGANGTTGMGSLGLGLGLGNEETIMFKLGANYHQVSNPNNLIGKSLSLNPMTNLLSADSKSFISDFQLAGGSLKVALFPSAYLPITLHADAYYNLGAGRLAGANDTELKNKAMAGALGFIGGLKLGKLEEAGNVMLGYQYKMLGVDSVLAGYNEDQLGGTGVMAHAVNLGVQLDNSTSLMITGQLSNPLATPAAGLYTVRTGLNHKF